MGNNLLFEQNIGDVTLGVVCVCVNIYQIFCYGNRSINRTFYVYICRNYILYIFNNIRISAYGFRERRNHLENKAHDQGRDLKNVTHIF